MTHVLNLEDFFAQRSGKRDERRNAFLSFSAGVLMTDCHNYFAVVKSNYLADWQMFTCHEFHFFTPHYSECSL